jgi:hypothetical protein
VSNVNGFVFSDAAHVTRQVFTPPTISFVSPTQLQPLPSPQTQTLHIYGSGFTSSSTLVITHGASGFNSVPARLHYQNANQIDYDIIVDAAQGNWTVKVVNGRRSRTSAASP